jgi:hypothetical protein
MSVMYPSLDELHELRRRVDVGEYSVDAQRVADSIVQKIIEIARIRRSLGRFSGGRSRPPRGSDH